MKSTKTERIPPPRGYRKHEDHELGRIFIRIEEDKVTYAARIGSDLTEGSLNAVIEAMRKFAETAAFDAVLITESRCTPMKVKRGDFRWTEAARPGEYLYGALADPHDPDSAMAILAIETMQAELADLNEKTNEKRHQMAQAIKSLPAFDPAKSQAGE